ncbi:MAG TPA: hypothetical protein VFV34_18545 [Blastocatellia bacterium]|nr:hypothetical protein [Blastocatellia bacterium]
MQQSVKDKLQLLTVRRLLLLTALSMLLAAPLAGWSGSTTASLATLCVNPGGTGGCFSSIQAAINAASPGDTINVAAGTYNEQVSINKTLTLHGAMAGIDARTRIGSESVITHPDGPVQIIADNVVIDGFTIQGASNSPSDPPFAALGAGIWTNPSFSATNGGYQILNNIVQNNIIGIYLNNTGVLQTVLQRNLLRNNNLTGPAGGRSIYSDLGLQNALIDQNAFTGDADTGVFTAGDPGTQSNITVSNNSAVGERLVVFLNTTASQITGNTMTTAPQSSAITIAGGNDNITIRGNALIGNVNAGIRVQDAIGGPSPNTNVTIDHNRLVGNPVGGVELLAGGVSGILDAQNNWWGCNAGPGSGGCDAATGTGIDFNPWLVLGISAAPTSIAPGGMSAITASLRRNSDGVDTSAQGFVPATTPAMFGATLGTMNPVGTTYTTGLAPSTFTAGGVGGPASISVTTDNQTVSTTVNIDVTIGFDVCIQDDSSKSVLKFNSFSGAYQFIDCKKGGTVTTGTATVTKIGCKIMLSSSVSKSGGATISAVDNTCTFIADATIKLSNGSTVNIHDSDTRNSSCACP